MMSMMMNMAAITAVTLLLLCCSVFASKDSQAKCDIYVETNKDIDVPLNLKLDKTHRLKWKFNDVVIFDRDGSDILGGKEGDVTENGSLRLKKVPKDKEGTYKPEVFNDGRAVQNLKGIKLCVIDPLPSPTVKVDCPQNKVKFTCNVGQAKNLKIEWFKNANKLEKDINKPYITYKAEEVEKDPFTCKVSNPINSISSQPVTQTCFTSGFVFPEEIWGINTWVLVGIGGGVVLLLIIVIIACCICNRRKKRLQIKDEEELRLGWTNPQPQHSHQHIHPPGQHHHHHHHQQQPAGHTGPRQHRSRQQRNHPLPRTPDQPNGQPQPSPRRPAQAPTPVSNCDDEQPPPLPQPRKKAPKTPRA